MSVNVLYKTAAKATGGRDGASSTLDGSLSVKLATPKELGGNGQGNNPEQLFAAGYAACFLGAMKYVASQDKSVQIPADVAVTAHVGIGPRSDGGFGLQVSLEVSLPGIAPEAAEALFEKTHKVCPYSHATRGNLDVATTLV
ncbi:organic hydroperoxide resistance protein [Phaeovulum sp. W22_SRMD_FR3]|uniref:organic hydroperoxide resistance protein n=1 Tax=Phaeovulum sp. W22_SRMD_FR3 TaxID=3240274 RepID=UPI003F9B5CAA